MNVNVRKKNKALSPTDLRREPILQKRARAEATHGQRQRQISDGDQDCSQEQERDNHPRKQVNPKGIVFLTSWGGRVGISNSRVGDENRRKGQPKRAIGRERCTITMSAKIDLIRRVESSVGRHVAWVNVFTHTHSRV